MEQTRYGSWLRLEYQKELWARDVTIKLKFVVGNLFVVFFAKDEHCNPEGKNETFYYRGFCLFIDAPVFFSSG